MRIEKKNSVEYIVLENIEQTGLVTHGFTTRHGGVSEDVYSNMNMGMGRGEDAMRVRENYRIFARSLGVQADSFVTSQQTHTVNVRRIFAEDKGKGVFLERGYCDVDGLITDSPEVTLVIFGADCVPIFLVDTQNHAIGMAHCGWMGTGKRMAEKIVEEMTQAFGTKPENIVAGIGPSIGKCCFQVEDDPVVRLFREHISFAEDIISDDPCEEGKYRIDLWETNRRLLWNMGVRNIEMAQLCTMCDTERFYSHRAMGERRGVMAGAMALK